MAKRVVIIGLGLMVFLGYLGRHKIKSFFWGAPKRTANSKEVKLLLREEPSFVELCSILIEKGVLSDESSVSDIPGKETLENQEFAAGKFIVLPGTRIENLMNAFLKGENGHGNAEVKVNVVFNNCTDIQDVGANISKCILADSASLVDYILDSKTLKKYGFTEEQVPALFLPQKYEMYFDTDAEEFVAFMANEWKAFWNEDRREKLKKVGLNSPSQATTLASIMIQEQSRYPEEWPTIAKLYLNRIERGIPLEADPTFKFCWPDRLKGVEHLLNVHRDRDCPYNTYLHAGLPPGPICLPSRKAIEAVLNPADVDYIFLCGDGTGHHNFASTNSEHNKNVAIYRKWLREYEKTH
ncbi:MAG: endolytic transglycosylase MltG [Crocinitomicaceae bacterium]|nr:endolytic transglycosylase MltG [Crocinitomicaceae bacterium]